MIEDVSGKFWIPMLVSGSNRTSRFVQTIKEYTMLRKMIPLCMTVVFAVLFAVAVSAEEAVKATAPVDGVVAADTVSEPSCGGCIDPKVVFGKRLVVLRKTLRIRTPAQCDPQTDDAGELVRIPAFKKLQHGFAKTRVWVGKPCGCEGACECVKPVTCTCPKTCPDQWVSFPAYKKGLFSLRSVEAWKPVPACH
ncbi:MAG: hypothetical protein LBQ50_07020 [Planctomycetaceae bacterium]|jgi:hypothetical protein|nr:hypothetical protein [Planctomycetaceae bacterium]